MWLALTDLFRAKWSYKVHKEWMRAVLRNRPDLRPEQLERTRRLIDAHGRDCLVENCESLIDGLDLPDLNDRHVLAAAIRGQADVIVICNLKDCPVDKLELYGIEAQHPDTCIMHLVDLEPSAVVGDARQHRASLKQPPKEVEEYLRTLERQGLVQTVAKLRGYASSI